MKRRNNRRSKITLHFKYMGNYCTLYSTKGSNPTNISYVVDSYSELFFLTPFETVTNKIIIPKESVKFVLHKVLALILSNKFSVSVDPKIIDVQRELDKKMSNQDNKLPIEIILGSKVSKGMPIPNQNERSFIPTKRAVLFYQDAKRYMYKTVDYAEYCDMGIHFGMYETMTQEQKNWYFFWRTKVRKCEYPETSLAYINIYLNELINCVGVSDARDGLNKIADLYIYYRQCFPLLDEYVARWIIDYSIVYELDKAEEIFNKIDFEWKSNDVDILLSSIENKLDLLGRFNVINYYSTYKITNSTYYLKCQDKEAVKKKVEMAFAAVENYFVKKFFYSICDKYSPYYSTRTVQAPFAGGFYAGIKMIDIKYKSYNGNPEFKNFVAQIVRYTEKVLRQQDRYRVSLKKIDLTENICRIIDNVLENKKEQPKKPEKIVIDMEKINNLIKDTDEMQRLLIDFEAEETEPESPVNINIIEKPCQTFNFGDYNTINDFYALLTALQRDVVKILAEGNETHRIGEIAVLNNTLPSKIFDDINELALETINDIIIDTTGGSAEISEQYAEEFARCIGR